MFDESTSQMNNQEDQAAGPIGSSNFSNNQGGRELPGATAARPALINKHGQVEDIFANSEKVREADRGAGFKVKAPTSQTASGRDLKVGINNDEASLLSDRQPVRVFSQTAENIPTGKQTEPDEIEFEPSSGFSKKKYFVIGLAGLVLIGGAAAYLFLGPGLQLFAPEQSSSVDSQAASPVTPPAADDNSLLPATVPPPESVSNGQASEQPIDLPPVAPPAEPLDSDQDGLSDSDERALGINPANPDTDADGLFDLEEIKVYLTNPADSDTDGDGYLDGEEVSNGFDPKGPGRLLPVIAN